MPYGYRRGYLTGGARMGLYGRRLQRLATYSGYKRPRNYQSRYVRKPYRRVSSGFSSGKWGRKRVVGAIKPASGASLTRREPKWLDGFVGSSTTANINAYVDDDGQSVYSEALMFYPNTGVGPNATESNKIIATRLMLRLRLVNQRGFDLDEDEAEQFRIIVVYDACPVSTVPGSLEILDPTIISYDPKNRILMPLRRDTNNRFLVLRDKLYTRSVREKSLAHYVKMDIKLNHLSQWIEDRISPAPSKTGQLPYTRVGAYYIYFMAQRSNAWKIQTTAPDINAFTIYGVSRFQWQDVN